jgi:lysophospholipase L1-like esterase
MPSLRTFAALVAAGSIALASAGPVRITCVGDSITVGVCSRSTGGYPKVLQGLLGSNYLVRLTRWKRKQDGRGVGAR